MRSISRKINVFFFFFQAEDGIRDLYVTGVQTCALPISFYAGILTASKVLVESSAHMTEEEAIRNIKTMIDETQTVCRARIRSEERRVGKECRSRWLSEH